jgi:hypothetical protein
MTRKRKVVASVVGVLLLVAVLAGCAGGDGDASASAVRKPAQAGSPVDVFYATLDKQPATSQKLCRYYFSLVNQGWGDDAIYTDLSDAGTFDQFYGQGHNFFKGLVRWCYDHE